MNNTYTNPNSTFAAVNGIAFTNAEILKAIGKSHDVFAKTKGKGWSKEDLEDLYQDTVLKVYRYLSSYDPSKSQLHTWVSMIASCCQNDAIRKQYDSFRFVSWEQLSPSGEVDNQDNADCDSCWEIAAGGEFDPCQVAESDDALDYINEAISSLKEDYAEILQLSLDGLKPREIAKLMGVPASIISTILFRAKKGLRNKLNGEICDDLDLAA